MRYYLSTRSGPPVLVRSAGGIAEAFLDGGWWPAYLNPSELIQINEESVLHRFGDEPFQRGPDTDVRYYVCDDPPLLLRRRQWGKHFTDGVWRAQWRRDEAWADVQWRPTKLIVRSLARGEPFTEPVSGEEARRLGCAAERPALVGTGEHAHDDGDDSAP